MPKAIKLPLNKITYLYKKQNKSMNEIAIIFKVGVSTIGRRLKPLGIIRATTKAQKIAYKTGRHPHLINGHGPGWKGGRKKVNGYIWLFKPNYSNSKDGYIREHRYIMEQYLGRRLNSWELVHHKNGIKDDNRLNNLDIVIRRKHYGKIICPKCSFHFLIK